MNNNLGDKMKKTIWLKDFSETMIGNNYINYKGYIIWQCGNGDGKWYSGSGHHYITNNLKSQSLHLFSFISLNQYSNVVIAFLVVKSITKNIPATFL